MIIRRAFPRTDEELTIAINKAYTTLTNVIPSDITLTAATRTKEIALYADWKNALKNCLVAESQKIMSTALATSTKKDAVLFIRHFIMVFNLGVDLGKYAKEQRILFYLKANSDKLPNLGTTALIQMWGERIVNGDAKRVAAGGAPMSNPSAAEVSAALQAFEIANRDQTVKTAAWKASLLALAKLRPTAKKVVRKIWDETETFYNELTPSAKRDKCRLWGITYKTNISINLFIKVVNSVTNEPIAGAENIFSEAHSSSITNSSGFSQFVTTVPDIATITTSKPGFQTATTEINFDSDVTDYDVVIKLTPVQ